MSIKSEARKILQKEDIDELKKIQAYNESRNHYEMQVENIKQRIEKAEKYKRKTYQNFMEDLITKQEYIAYVSQYEEEIKGLQEQLCIVNEKSDLQQEINAQYDEWVEAFRDYINVTKLTRDMVLELISRIEIRNDGSITIYYNFQNPYMN